MGINSCPEKYYLNKTPKLTLALEYLYSLLFFLLAYWSALEEHHKKCAVDKSECEMYILSEDKDVMSIYKELAKGLIR